MSYTYQKTNDVVVETKNGRIFINGNEINNDGVNLKRFKPWQCFYSFLAGFTISLFIFNNTFFY